MFFRIKRNTMEQKPKSGKIMAAIMMSVVFLIVCCKDDPVGSGSEPDMVERTRLYPDDLAYKVCS